MQRESSPPTPPRDTWLETDLKEILGEQNIATEGLGYFRTWLRDPDRSLHGERHY